MREGGLLTHSLAGSSNRKAGWLLWLAVVSIPLLICGVYWSSLGNGFHLDDFPNIVDVPAMHLETFTGKSVPSALAAARLPDRVLPNLTLIWDWYRGGGEPSAFQVTNLTIHVLTALMVFAFFRLILSRHVLIRGQGASVREPIRERWLIFLPLIAALAWAVHPIQVQGVTYIVQRMASMVALFMLISVYAYVRGRTAPMWSPRLIWFVVAFVAGAAAFYSKENASILPLWILLAEYTVCRPKGPVFRWWFDRYLWLAGGLVFLYVVIDLFVVKGPLAVKFGSYGNYHQLDYGMSERLLTQARVWWFHIGQMLWPMPGRFGLEHDFSISRGFFQPRTTFLSILGVLGILVMGMLLLFRPRWRVVAFLLLSPFVLLIPEGTIVGLELIFEHRMYLPSVALLGLLLLGAWEVSDGHRKDGQVWCSGLCLFSFCCLHRLHYVFPTGEMG